MNTNASVGATVNFRVYAATTNPPLTYQWQHEGTNLLSATNTILVIPNVTVAHAGNYVAWVTNAIGGFTNSRTAVLTVDSLFAKITQGGPATDMGGSATAAWIDYDLDGWLDLFVGNAGNGVVNFLYRNNRDGSFTKTMTNLVGAVAGSAWGVAWGDYDNDGRPDLFVANTENRLPTVFHNEGGGAFKRVTTGALVSTALDGIMPLWGDYDNDGFIDLFLSTGYWSGPQTDRLYHNERNGAFRIMTAAEVGPLASDNVNDQAIGWIDYDCDGDLDLFIAYMSPPVDGPASYYLFRNSLNGPFEKVALTNFNFVRQCWGNAWGDYDNDGDPDVFMPSWFSTNALLKNLNGQGFTNVAYEAGLALAMASEGSAWGDYDNDGRLDLCVANYQGQAKYPGGQALFHNNRDGTFARITTGSPAHEGGRTTAVAWGDYDNDGFLDLYIACGDGTPERNLFYRNNGPANGNTNHWLKVKLDGQASNRMGIGAKIRVLANTGGQSISQLRTITGQHSWVGDNGLQAHFGLGDATNVTTLRIEWPSGNVQELVNVTPDRLLTVTEPTLIAPARPSVSLNGSVTLTRTALAGATYQWRLDGVDLVGQTNRILNLTNITADMAGRYSVVASNATTLTTNFVYLFVDTQFTKITAGPLVTDTGMCPAISSGDYDGDGYADLFVSRYQLGTSAVYHNQRDGTFDRVPSLPFGRQSSEVGVWADLDNDGAMDLLHERLGSLGSQAYSASVYFNNGDGTFAVHQRGAVLSYGDRSLVDYNNDGFLDVYYSKFAPNRLYRNNGDRTFTLMTAGNVGPVASVTTFGASCWADYNDDGWPDVYAPHYQGSQSLMFRNDGTGRFVAVSNLVTRTAAPAIAGAWGDYDNDGRLDLSVAAIGGGTSVVYRNLGNGEFERPAGTPALAGTHPFAAWADYDNDGFLDLFLAGYQSGNKLFHNNGNGTFTRIATGSIVNELPLLGAGSYAGLWFDYDNDGFLDLYVVNGDDASSIPTVNQLYHNNGNSNAWLRVKLVGTTSNRDGVGAKVRVQATYAGQVRWQRRDIIGGDEHNGNHLTADFGLGNATKVTTLRIEWPSGVVQQLANVAVNQILTVCEPPALCATVHADCSCELTIKAEPNRVWEIQASSDLLTWQTLTTVTNTNFEFQFVDPAAAGMDCRFYRLKAQ